MTAQERRDQAKREGRRNACPICFGDWWSGYTKTPHADDCPKYGEPLPPLPQPWAPKNVLWGILPPVRGSEEDPDPDRDDYRGRL